MLKFAFIIGGDLVNTLTSWDEGDKLVEEILFLIFNRKGHLFDKENLPKNYI